jgi:formate-dependent nitrite reductase cytochrome c552 subunit
MIATVTLCYINYIYMKKMYKLLIVFDENEDECETVVEYFDDYSDEEVIDIEDYTDKDLRTELIKMQVMGEA